MTREIERHSMLTKPLGGGGGWGLATPPLPVSPPLQCAPSRLSSRLLAKGGPFHGMKRASQCFPQFRSPPPRC